MVMNSKQIIIILKNEIVLYVFHIIMKKYVEIFLKRCLKNHFIDKNQNG